MREPLSVERLRNARTELGYSRITELSGQISPAHVTRTARRAFSREYKCSMFALRNFRKRDAKLSRIAQLRVDWLSRSRLFPKSLVTGVREPKREKCDCCEEIAFRSPADRGTSRVLATKNSFVYLSTRTSLVIRVVPCSSRSLKYSRWRVEC